MVQDVGSDDVVQGDAGQGDDGSKKRKGGLLPIIALIILVLVILWLLWQFLGSFPVSNRITEVTSSSTIDVNVPVPPEPEIPAQAESTETVTDVQTVPDVVGDPQGSAAMTLENSGYVVSVTYVYSDSTPSGLVIGQNPTGGTELRAGAVVGIIVSRGNVATPMVIMPDVVGLKQAAAEKKVRAAGLKPYILHGTDPPYAGLVGRQWPLAGRKVPKGSDGFIQVMITR